VRGIDPLLVELVWRDLTAYPSGRVESESAQFLEQQPHVALFARRMTSAQHPSVQQAALGLAFLLFKIVERSLDRPFPEVSAARIAAAYEATRDWLEGAASADPASVLERGTDPGHPTLAAHIVSVFYGDAPGDYDEAVRASLLLVLRTLCAALDLGAVEP
jgi:hypothetical protein